MIRLYEFFLRGGPLMWPLLILSITAVALAIERWLALRREPTDADLALAELSRSGQPLAELAESRTDSIGRLAAIAQAHRDEPPERLEQALDAAGNEVIGQMEAPLNALRAIAEISPLIGFLGTVVGMVGAFDSIVAEGTTSPAIVAQGISTALLTTAGGLGVGIIAYLGHSVLNARLDRIAAALERIAHHLAGLAGKEPA